MRGDLDGGLKGRGAPARDIVIGIDASLQGFGITAMSISDSLFDTRILRVKSTGVERLIEVVDENMDAYIFDLQHTYGHVIMDVAMEDAVFKSYSGFPMGEMAGQVKRWWRLNYGMYPARVSTTMVKKYATDNGTAKKAQVMVGCFKHWGVEFTDDNAADSFVIAKVCAAMQEDGDQKIHAPMAFQREVVKKMHAGDFRDHPRST